MLNQGTVDFASTYLSVAAESIMNLAEEHGSYHGKQKIENRMEKKMEVISIELSKGLAKPFTGKDGNE